MFFKAYLTGVSFLVGVIVELEDVFVEESLGVFQCLFAAFGAIEELADVVLDSSQLEDHSRDCVNDFLPNLYPSATARSFPTIKYGSSSF